MATVQSNTILGQYEFKTEELIDTSKMENQVQSQLFLDVVIRKSVAIFQLLACKDKPLLFLPVLDVSCNYSEVLPHNLSLGTLSYVSDILNFPIIMYFGDVFVRYWERMNLGNASHLPNLNLFSFLKCQCLFYWVCYM